MDIVCVGDCGIDQYDPGGKRLFGGITANFARPARDCFADDDIVRIVSCVGDDEGGDMVSAALAETSIDCHILRRPGQTPVQYIEIETDGEKRFTRYDEGVLRDFQFSDRQRDLIAGSDLLVAPVYLQIVDLFDALMSIPTRGRVAVDFADFLQVTDYSPLSRHIETIDIGFFGLTPAQKSTIDKIEKLAREFQRLFVVTLGADGSVAFDGATRHECDAVNVVNVIDTTGAGDAFAAAFLASFCDGGDVAKALASGSSLASKVIQRVGSYATAPD